MNSVHVCRCVDSVLDVWSDDQRILTPFLELGVQKIFDKLKELI